MRSIIVNIVALTTFVVVVDSGIVVVSPGPPTPPSTPGPPTPHTPAPPTPAPRICSQCSTSTYFLSCDASVESCYCYSDVFQTANNVCPYNTCCRFGSNDLDEICPPFFHWGYVCDAANTAMPCRCINILDEVAPCTNIAKACPGAPFLKNGRNLERIPEEKELILWDQFDIQEHSSLQDCFDQSYVVYLHVHEGHLSAVAWPSADIECPSWLVHAVAVQTESDSATVHKQAIVRYDASEEEAGQGYKIGVFQGDTLLQAYLMAPVTNGDERYHILHNNCAVFLLNLARHLDIPITRMMRRYIVRHLVADWVSITQLRKHWFGRAAAALTAGSSISDEKLAELVVQDQLDRYI